MKIKSRLTEIMVSRQITVRELAAMADMSTSTVMKARDDIGARPLEIVAKIAMVLDVSTCDLFTIEK